MSTRARLQVGTVQGAHGVRGVVRVRLHDPRSSALRVGQQLWLCRDDDARAHVVASCAEIPGHAGTWRVGLVGVDDREAAGALGGCTIELPRDALPAPAADEFYLADAMGLPVKRRGIDEGRTLGTIAGITSNGAQDLFEVRYRAKDGRARTWLLPVLPSFVRDVDAEAVWVELPEGLLPDELEAP